MKVSVVAALAVVTPAVLASGGFESRDFDIKKALYGKIDKSLTSKLDFDGSYGSPCYKACKALQVLFDDSKWIMHEQASAYDAFTQSFWSAQQSSLDPSCIFKPSTATDVSIFVLISRITQCKFAVKGGGHAQYAGASSIQDGIAVSFEYMKEVTLSRDGKTAAVGPGNNWYEVYKKLENYNMTVIGARLSAVGVGGATLGGGVSYLSNKYGWACDNVASFELVIACGSLIIASPTSYSDLYWALRGGGNNFGIVTSFRLYAYPQGDMQFTQFEYNDTYFSRVISAFVNVGKNSADDPNAQQNLLFGHKNGTKIVRGQLAYQHPAESPRIFREYRRIPMFSKFPDIRIRQSDETALAGATAPKGFRQSFWVATCDLDLDFAIYATKLFYSKSKKFEAFPDVNANLNLQVITTRQISQMAKNGGNPLGLSYTKRPLLILLLFPQWSDQAYDNSIYRTNQEIFKHLKIEAKNRGLYNKFIYMNYASEYQDVIASYGKENKQKLKDIAKKYDPKEVFQKLQPGYFKLNGAPLQELP